MDFLGPVLEQCSGAAHDVVVVFEADWRVSLAYRPCLKKQALSVEKHLPEAMFPKSSPGAMLEDVASMSDAGLPMGRARNLNRPSVLPQQQGIQERWA